MGENKNVNLYRDTAYLYDLDQRSITQDDIPFYLNFASKINGDILELACGTGRVAIPLAKAGYPIWGLDLSKEMLGQMETKIKKMDVQIQERITTIHANMTNFEINRKFSLILTPFRSFQSLLTEEQQRLCLQNVNRHLSDDGYFIIDVFKPHSQLNEESWVKPEALDWEVEDSKTGNIIRRTNIKRKIDTENQIIYPELIYYVKDKDGKERKTIEQLALKYYYEEQIRDLLESSGFNIVEEIGYYDGRPISEGPELIFICNKNKG